MKKSDSGSNNIYPINIPEERNLLDSFPLNHPEKRQIIDHILEKYRNSQGAVMVILNEIQSHIGFVSRPIQEYVALKLNVPASTVHGVITFYSFFTTTPRGRHTVKFCMGTACYVGGTPQLVHKAKQILSIDPGQTTEDGNITLEVCRCVGACSQAPVVVVDEQLYGRMRPSKFPALMRNFTKQQQNEE